MKWINALLLVFTIITMLILLRLSYSTEMGMYFAEEALSNEGLKEEARHGLQLTKSLFNDIDLIIKVACTFSLLNLILIIYALYKLNFKKKHRL